MWWSDHQRPYNYTEKIWLIWNKRKPMIFFLCVRIWDIQDIHFTAITPGTIRRANQRRWKLEVSELVWKSGHWDKSKKGLGGGGGGVLWQAFRWEGSLEGAGQVTGLWTIHLFSFIQVRNHTCCLRKGHEYSVRSSSEHTPFTVVYTLKLASICKCWEMTSGILSFSHEDQF